MAEIEVYIKNVNFQKKKKKKIKNTYINQKKIHKKII
jgi:hypothetical protein